MNKKTKLQGAILTFVILELIHLFFFFGDFPNSVRGAFSGGYNTMLTVAGWLSMLTMFTYCIICLVSVFQLVMRSHRFLFTFQVSGIVATAGNLVVFILRQAGSVSSAADYYWVLFIAALFWTVIWCMFFARSSRVFSYMGEDDSYLRNSLFTRSVKSPEPWQDLPVYNAAYRAPGAPQYPGQQQPYPGPYRPQNAQPQPQQRYPGPAPAPAPYQSQPQGPQGPYQPQPQGSPQAAPAPQQNTYPPQQGYGGQQQ